jgi:RNA 2',3'-cyclic 3'-phosphodiesterase
MGGDDSGALETGALRLFVAVDVPDDVKRSVATAIEPWRQTFPEARWIPPENWHITLTFLGATGRELVPWIEETIGAVASAHAPVVARLTNLGAFPIGDRARVLWVGVDDPDHRLAALAADLEAALVREFPLEARAFHPHLTVARSEPPVRLPNGFAETTVSAGPFNVDRLVLFRSYLRRPRPRYEAIHFFSLSG